MPLAQELKLKEIAAKYAKAGKLHRKKGQSVKDAMNAFTYGTMRREGWKPSRQKK